MELLEAEPRFFVETMNSHHCSVVSKPSYVFLTRAKLQDGAPGRPELQWGRWALLKHQGLSSISTCLYSCLPSLKTGLVLQEKTSSERLFYLPKVDQPGRALAIGYQLKHVTMAMCIIPAQVSPDWPLPSP